MEARSDCRKCGVVEQTRLRGIGINAALEDTRAGLGGDLHPTYGRFKAYDFLVYRLQRREEREGVLSALVAELELHESWVGPGYPKGCWKDMSAKWWGSASDQLVYKPSTVATDNAIQVGPSLFINRDLVRALVL